MMAAYQPQPGMHPGMAPHGHPGMTPGQPPINPAQIVAAQQQMGHPGVSGPGAPHVTQAGAMMGMQPGVNGMVGPGGMGAQHPGAQMGGMPGQMGAQSMAGGAPNAHALSHMTPQAAMQQQQALQQQMQANPQFMQQQMIMRRQQQMMAQANGMAGMHPGAMQGMNPQQLQQLQQQNAGMSAQGVQLPQHLLQQQLRLQGHHHQNPNQQAQQQIAMQHANSNQGAQPAQPNQQPGQPQQHPGQIRPQSRMANAGEQNQGGPQQGVQQNPQGQQQPQQGQPNAPQNPQQNPQAAQQQGQQPNMQGMAQQQGFPPGWTPQHQAAHIAALNQTKQQLFMQQLQRQNMQNRQMAQSQQQISSSGQFILAAMLLSEQLSSFDQNSGKEIAQWNGFVERHFAPEARLRHSFRLDDDSKTKSFDIARPVIARYFQLYFESGVSSMRMHIEHAREQQTPQNKNQVNFQNATMTIAYGNGARLDMMGSVSLVFAADNSQVEVMEIHTLKYEEIVERAVIERLLTNWSPTMGNRQSPKLSKNKPPKQQKMQQSQFDGLTIDHFPKAPKGVFPVSPRVQQFLEIGETMGVMSELINFAQERKMRPENALEALVQQYDVNAQANGGPNQQGNPQISLPPNGVPVGNRTPNMGNMQMPNAQPRQFASPSVANLNLPMQNGMPGMNGSPHMPPHPGLTAPNMAMNMVGPTSHTPSPHQVNMAPPMMAQHSAQGTNSSAASANTSPQVNNKRRRSQVKLEGDEGGGENGGGQANRVKPSPRMNKKAKPGGA